MRCYADYTAVSKDIVTLQQGADNVVINDWGLYIYTKIPRLVTKASTDRHGLPWNLAENKNSQACYRKGAYPAALLPTQYLAGDSFLSYRTG